MTFSIKNLLVLNGGQCCPISRCSISPITNYSFYSRMDGMSLPEYIIAKVAIFSLT